MRIAVTGGAGFIGSTLIKELIHSELDITSLKIIDNLTYAGSLDNLGSILELPNVHFHNQTICDKSAISEILNDVEYVFHLAAESHVDRSIKDASPFWNTNVLGTVALLDSIKHRTDVKFLHVSTDEVYGSTALADFVETDPLNPSSPYSASKAASDLACLAYGNTYNINYLITRCTNNFGPNQYPEKLLPVLVKQAVNGEPLTLYGNGANIREWIPVKAHAQYLIQLMFSDLNREIFNIGSGIEKSNLEIAEMVLSVTHSESKINFVEDRLGHDYRYAVSTKKLNSKLPQIKTDFELEMNSCIKELMLK
jgi:dTDP-glucose 4,6-dehydratase